MVRVTSQPDLQSIQAGDGGIPFALVSAREERYAAAVRPILRPSDRYRRGPHPAQRVRSSAPRAPAVRSEYVRSGTTLPVPWSLVLSVPAPIARVHACACWRGIGPRAVPEAIRDHGGPDTQGAQLLDTRTFTARATASVTIPADTPAPASPTIKNDRGDRSAGVYRERRPIPHNPGSDCTRSTGSRHCALYQSGNTSSTEIPAPARSRVGPCGSTGCSLSIAMIPIRGGRDE